MPYQGSITLVDLSDGTSGIDSATIYLYKRAAADATVTGPSGTLRYTFSEHTLSGTESAFNGWQQSIPSGTNPIWVTAATATASADVGYDDIIQTEWSSPTIMAQNGQNGQPGFNQATLFLYQRAATGSTLTAPSNLTYNFSTGQLSGTLGNWQRSVPASTGNPCYVISTAAISQNSSIEIASSAWSSPVIFVEDGTQGPQGVSVTSERELYWLKTNSTDPSQIIWDSTHSQPSQTIYSNDITNAWTSVVPTYVSGGTYYTCIEASLSNSTKVWSAPVINNALTNTSSNTALMGGHFIYLGSASTSGLTPASANVVETIKNTRQEDVTYDPTQWGHNVHIGSNGIALRFNELDYSVWDTAGLTLFEPPNGSTRGNAAATLTTNGLILAKGGITSGTSGASGYVYLSSSDYGADYFNTGRADWRQIIGTNFGIAADGSLYATSGVFSASINGASITGGSIRIDNINFNEIEQNDHYLVGNVDGNNYNLWIAANELKADSASISELLVNGTNIDTKFGEVDTNISNLEGAITNINADLEWLTNNTIQFLDFNNKTITIGNFRFVPQSNGNLRLEKVR